MSKLNKIIFLLIILSFATSSYAKYLNEQDIKTILPSNTRIIIPLLGQFEKSDDETTWENVNIPYSDVSTKKIILVKKIKFEKEQLGNYSWQLFFLGFNHQAEIQINGQFLGRFISGMAPLWIKVPHKALNSGSNEIKIIFTIPKDVVTTALDRYIYARKRYNGLVREAYLIGNPPIWISDVKISYDFTNNLQNAQISARVSFSSANFDLISNYKSKDTTTISAIKNKVLFTLESKIAKLSGETIALAEPIQITIEPDRTIEQDIKLNITSPLLWSPESPNLYQLQLKISQFGRKIDEYSQNFGLRKINFNQKDNSYITLNGEKIKLKALTYIDYHIASGQSLSLWRMEEDVRMLKSLGANALRFKFNPPHPYFSNLCDKYGLLMLIDLPVYEIPQSLLERDELKVYVRNFSRLASYYKQNYASTIGFGFSDGLCEEYFPNSFASEIKNQLTSDGNYLFYKFVNTDEKLINTENFDFIGFNLKKETPISNLSQLLKNNIVKLENKPFLTCFGTPLNENNHNGYSDPFSHEHQAFVIKSIYNLSQQLGAFGVMVNSFNDYELNNPYLATNNYNTKILTTGIVDASHKQRFSFSMLQSLFNDEKEPLINAGSYAGETLISFIIIGFILLVVLLFFINRFRRFREYLTRALLRPYNFYSDIRDQRIIPSFQTLVLGLIISFTIGLFTTSMLFYYKYYDLTQYLIMLITPSQTLQEILYRMIWMPEVSFLLISIYSFLLIFIISAIIKIFAFFSRARIYFSDCLIISVWAGVPFVFLLPLSIPLIRLLEISDNFALFSLILFAIVKLWVIARILKATAVVFDKPPAFVYFIGIFLILIFALVPIGFYQIYHQFFAYLGHFICTYIM